jgi:hypothetical protein
MNLDWKTWMQQTTWKLWRIITTLTVYVYVYVQRNTTRFRVTIVIAEQQEVLNILFVCLYSCLNYPACNAHAPYYIVIFGLSGCTIFFQIVP